MTDTRTRPPCEALAQGLNEALDALRGLGSLAAALGEQTTLTTGYVIGVRSVAEVNQVAADMDVEPSWVMPWTYAAAWSEGTVTVTVSFTTDPPVAPADAALIEVPGRAA
jgi:hypothetical protein